MKFFRLIAVSIALITCLYACSTRRSTSNDGSAKGKTDLTSVKPNVKNPNRAVLNASGDGLTPGIATTNGAGNRENATNIVNEAISRANTGVKFVTMNLDSIGGPEFLGRGSVGDMKAISLSQNILKTTGNARIKAYAATILKDHQQVQTELKKLAAEKKINVPSSEADYPPVANNQTDLKYVESMIEEQQYHVRLFTAGSKSGDQAIRDFSLKYLPLMKKHLEGAQDLTKEVSPVKK